VKIQFVFPGHSTNLSASVEDSLENCARLLLELGAGLESTHSKRELFPSPEVRPEKDVISGNEEADEWVPRTNRRKMVLETIQELRSAGAETPSLGQIKHRFAQLFPEESLENLDQVVRDIANKTSKLERLERGTFKLTE
jgi:hypothetical protein